MMVLQLNAEEIAPAIQNELSHMKKVMNFVVMNWGRWFNGNVLQTVCKCFLIQNIYFTQLRKKKKKKPKEEALTAYGKNYKGYCIGCGAYG